MRQLGQELVGSLQASTFSPKPNFVPGTATYILTTSLLKPAGGTKAQGGTHLVWYQLLVRKSCLPRPPFEVVHNFRSRRCSVAHATALAYASTCGKNRGALRNFVACSKEYANLINTGSLHARPKNEIPTGKP